MAMQSALSAAQFQRRRGVWSLAVAVLPCLILGCVLLTASGCGGDDPPESNGESDSGSGESSNGETTGESTTGTDSTEPSGTQEAVSNVRLIDDGLTESEREEFFHLTMGSELFPLRWMQNMISSSTGKPFLENVERFGLVPDPTNEDGLPIGLTAAKSIDVRGVGKMVGMNCSACHTGVVTYQGKSVIIVGGSSLFDVTLFTNEMVASAAATAKDPEKLLAFVNRLWKSGRGAELPSHKAGLAILSGVVKDAKLRTALTSRIKAVSENASSAAHGELLNDFKRLAGQAQKDIRGGLLHGLEEKVHTAISSKLHELDIDLSDVSDDIKNQAVKRLTEDVFIVARLLAGRIAFMKKLGELQKLDLPQTNGGPGRADDFGAGRNLLFSVETAQPMTGPCSIPPLFDVAGVHWADWDGNTSSTMGRSMLTALAGGAAFNTNDFTSTVPPQNLARLEEIAAKLKPPAWPADVLGELDKEKVAAGETLFKEHCAKCHRPAMVDATDAPKDAIYPLEELGTDPNRLKNYLKPLGNQNFAEALQKTSQAYLDQAAKDAGFSEEDAAKWSEGHPNVWRDTNGYAARSLAGIWSTAPYLHNGSVPTLWHVLSPAADRPEKFSVGSSQYDPEKVGYVSEISDSSPFVFDTTQSGNSNSGHEYGTTLSDSEKMSLIEFLKSL